MTIKTYATKRLLLIIPTVVSVSFIVFILVYRSNLNILDALINPPIDIEVRFYANEIYGLEYPWYFQYWCWLKQVISGNLGFSILQGRDVTKHILTGIFNTLSYQAAALVLSFSIGIPAGVFSAVKQHSIVGKGIMKASLIGVSLPIFLVGPVIILSAQILGWIPEASTSSRLYLGDDISYIVEFYLQNLKYMMLLIFTMTIVTTGYITQKVRSSIITALREDFVIALRSKGLKDKTVICHHALKNAVPSVVKALIPLIAAMLGAAPLIESVFKWPGLGRYFLQAVIHCEQFVILGVVLLLGMHIVIAHAVCDIFSAWVNPGDMVPFHEDFSL
jgi:peptide/nickel transport system permease protein